MSQTISSYRSSSSSTRLRRLLRSQDQEVEENTTDMSHNIENRSRVRSRDYSAASEKPASNKSSSKPSVKSKKESESPVMVFFRILFERCFTTRRKKRSRGMATRKMKNNNYQTRDDYDKKEGAKMSRGYSSIPTNEQEMFSMLHSRSRARQRNSGSSRDSPNHRRNNSGITLSLTSSDTLPPAISFSPPLLIIEPTVHQSAGKQEQQQNVLS
eukprot:CAMPEP_0116125620 /NCGR_PEP_ID=MMETSP0329-20121206/5906_1 /TAXON_ID=697910 /ORGANISM="Pseudo-nitzschia arenysensis, Strain B593" /LENGTH=212 /DNA_ID=CAMNT_0003619669 /DNA_START=201 /DNA_END=839 /DNA_ORIENTATION=-